MNLDWAMEDRYRNFMKIREMFSHKIQFVAICCPSVGMLLDNLKKCTTQNLKLVLTVHF